MFERRKKNKNDGIEDKKGTPNTKEQKIANQISDLGTELIKGSNDKRTASIILMKVPINDQKTGAYALCGGEEMSLVTLLCSVAKEDPLFKMVLFKAAAVINNIPLNKRKSLFDKKDFDDSLDEFE